MYGVKVYRCLAEQIKHVLTETWLPVMLRTWKSTVPERGAGNLVELDPERFPPQAEREERQTDELKVIDDQGPRVEEANQVLICKPVDEADSSNDQVMNHQ